MGNSKRELQALPGPVEDLFGYALYLAQAGKKHDQAKPLKRFGSAGVLEVAEDWDRSTYRAVVYDTVQGGGFRVACVPEEVNAWEGHAEGRYRSDPRTPQDRREKFS
jgi:hypothetical protein